MHIGIILNHHAACHSERPAVILGDQTLSFHMLSTRSNRLANALIDRGLKPGDRVILYVGNSLALVEAIAAVWKAGGVTVPITPWIVGPELAFMVGDCQPFAILYGPDQTAHVDHALADYPEVRRLFIDDIPAPNITTLDRLLPSGTEAPPPRLPADPPTR